MNDLPSAVNEEIVAMIQQLNIEGDYTSLTNINDISNALNRDIHHILKFIAIKLKATLNFEYMAVEGIFDIQTIQRALMEFIDMFVACSACGSQKTWLIALRRKPVSLFCGKCESHEPVQKHRLCKYIKEFPPAVERYPEHCRQQRKLQDGEIRDAFDRFVRRNRDDFVAIIREAKRLRLCIQTASFRMIPALFTENIVVNNEIQRFQCLLHYYATKTNDFGDCQLHILFGFEALVRRKYGLLLTETPFIFKVLYDMGIVEKMAFLNWRERIDLSPMREDSANEIREVAYPFYRWLKGRP